MEPRRQIVISETEDDTYYHCTGCGCEHNFTRGCPNCDGDQYEPERDDDRLGYEDETGGWQP